MEALAQWKSPARGDVAIPAATLSMAVTGLVGASAAGVEESEEAQAEQAALLSEAQGILSELIEERMALQEARDEFLETTGREMGADEVAAAAAYSGLPHGDGGTTGEQELLEEVVQRTEKVRELQSALVQQLVTPARVSIDPPAAASASRVARASYSATASAASVASVALAAWQAATSMVTVALVAWQAAAWRPTSCACHRLMRCSVTAMTTAAARTRKVRPWKTGARSTCGARAPTAPPGTSASSRPCLATTTARPPPHRRLVAHDDVTVRQPTIASMCPSSRVWSLAYCTVRCSLERSLILVFLVDRIRK